MKDFAFERLMSVDGEALDGTHPVQARTLTPVTHEIEKLAKRMGIGPLSVFTAVQVEMNGL